MKKLVVIFFVSFTFSAFSQKSTLFIPAKQTLEISYPTYEMFEANLKGTGSDAIEVTVVSKETGEQLRGFGLGKFGDVYVMVETENTLVLTNTSRKGVTVKMGIKEESRKVLEKKSEYISFTLRNESAKAIPLIIPGVMNPNLSPKSNSGVDLKIGQKIYFKKGGRKMLLLEVDDSINEGDIIKVAALIKERSQM